MPRAAALVALLFVGQAARGGPGADEHLLAGARLFRADQYAEALVEFRVAERLGAEGAGGYAAASLVKLGRSEEALEAFGAMDAAGLARDPLLDYYRALACYEARLYLCADRHLADVGERTGPRIGAQVRKIRADIAALLAKEPSAAAIDWYHDRAGRTAAAGRVVLAVAYYREAAALAERRRDAHRRAEAVAALARLKGDPRAETAR